MLAVSFLTLITHLPVTQRGLWEALALPKTLVTELYSPHTPSLGAQQSLWPTMTLRDVLFSTLPNGPCANTCLLPTSHLSLSQCVGGKTASLAPPEPSIPWSRNNWSPPTCSHQPGRAQSPQGNLERIILCLCSLCWSPTWDRRPSLQGRRH